VDIYLPDLKYYSSELSKKYSEAHNYFEVATAAIAEMVRQVGTPEFDDEGIMTKGVIVRHLLLPGCIEDSKRIIKYLYDTYGDDIYVSIMNQYTPMKGIEERYPELANKVSYSEYDRLTDYAIDIGIENGFIQEGDTAEESFIPDFDMEGI
jgi:putative pyruvate formate lyase activating enzyme